MNECLFQIPLVNLLMLYDLGASMPTSNLPLGGSNYGECISVNAPGQDVRVPTIGGIIITGRSNFNRKK